MNRHRQRGETAFLSPTSYRYLSQVERRITIVRDLARGMAPETILDLGCGDGRISLQFVTATSKATLVDTSPTMLKQVSEAIPGPLRDRVTLVNESIAAFDDTAAYSLVLAIGVLGHVGDLSGTLDTVARLVSPDGRVILQLTDAATISGGALCLVSRLRTAKRGYRLNYLTERTILTEMAQRGLTLADSTRYFAFYRRTTGPPIVQFAARLGQIVQPILDRWGAEKFLVFRPSIRPHIRRDRPVHDRP